MKTEQMQRGGFREKAGLPKIFRPAALCRGAATTMLGVMAFIFAGCQPDSSTPSPVATNQTYAVRGVIQQIPPDRRHVTIKHEKIPGYMAAMTMDFSVKDTNSLAGYAPGDEITFSLVVTETDDWIEKLKKVGEHGLSGPPGWHLVENSLNDGDTLPDYEFTSETGRIIHFSDFRGSAVAFTFFFTSCPLPEYCPRMNKNFSEAQKILLAQTNSPQNWELLSISFDSSFDTPERLAGYGKFYRGDATNHWLFAVASTNTLASLAPKVDLNFWREGGSISHNLRTVVLDPNGKIFRQFDGNEWTPGDLAAAVAAAQAR
jgi:protein SCO1